MLHSHLLRSHPITDLGKYTEAICNVQFVVALILSTFVPLATNQAHAAELPNILLIMADDLGYGDVGCYNPESKVETPNIDRLASEGMRFTDAHSPCSVCTPTRYSLMTGQMAFRIPNGGRVFSGAGGPSLITPDRLTLPKMLQRQGYHTACVGKWHVGLTFLDHAGEPIHEGGLNGVRKIDFSREILGGPCDCGFDEFFGTACCPTTDWLYAFIEGKRIPVPPAKQLDKKSLPKHPYSHDNRLGLVAPNFDLEEVDVTFLEKSKQFLLNHMRDEPNRPFFLFHSTQAVHLPSFPSKTFQGSTNAGPHGDFISELDYIVGELLRTLEDLDLSENTIVMFTSDNGPEVTSVYHMRKDYQHDGARPWRGVKRDNWEGGHRVPFIVRWPGKVPAETTCSQMMSLTDVMATFADVVAVQLPNDAAEDSFSMMPAMLQQERGAPIRPYILHQGFFGEKKLAVRRGNWKYLNHQGSGGNRYDNNRMLELYQLPSTNADNAPDQLYNLAIDPGEKHNLVDVHPEIAKELKKLLAESIERGRTRPSQN